MKEDNQGSWKILTSPYSAVICSCCCRTVIKKDTGRPFFFQTINEQYRQKPKEGCHMLLFMSFRFRGNTVVPDIHSSNLALLKFSFRMADTMQKTRLSVLVHKDKITCWECDTSGTGNSENRPGTL